MKMAIGSNVRNRFCISPYSGGAKNLHAPYFREKPENFGRIGRFEE
jgi:hypothetical protein